MFVDIILLNAVSLEKHPVVNFKPYPLSFSWKMSFSGNQLSLQISSGCLTHVRPFCFFSFANIF
jgi:hypothetical protein